MENILLFLFKITATILFVVWPLVILISVFFFPGITAMLGIWLMGMFGVLILGAFVSLILHVIWAD